MGPYPRPGCNPSGGVENATVNLVEGLDRCSDIHVEIVANSTSESRVRESEGRVTYIGHRHGVRGWARDLHQDLLNEIRQRDADVVHLQGLPSVALRVPGSVLTVHGLAERDVWKSHSGVGRVPKSLAAAILEGFPRRLARQVIAITDSVSQSYSGSRTKVWSIPNAINGDYFRMGTTHARGDACKFALVGNVSPLKNTAGVIIAFANVVRQRSDAHLSIAGDGVTSAYGQYCADLVSSLHLKANIDFLGPQAPDQVVNLLNRSGTLVHFSNQEVAPMAIAEALAAGAAVLASDIGGIPVMLEGLPGCHVVTPGDVDALSRQMILSLSQEDADDATKRHLAASVFDPNAVAALTIQVYHEVLMRRAHRASGRSGKVFGC